MPSAPAPFHDSDWDRAHEAPRSPRRSPPWGWIGLGAAAGVVLTAAAMFATESWRRPPQVIEMTMPPAAGVGGASEVTVLPAQAPVPAASASGASEAAAEPAAGPAPRAIAAPPTPRLTLEQRKARAWARFYQRPSECEAPNPSAQQMIDCANHHIRARREFEARWAASAALNPAPATAPSMPAK